MPFLPKRIRRSDLSTKRTTHPLSERSVYDEDATVPGADFVARQIRGEYGIKIKNANETFIQREMMHEDGSFFSALDADTEGREGKYYIWSKKEIMNLLGDELGPLYCKVYIGTFFLTHAEDFSSKSLLDFIYMSCERYQS